MDSLLISVWSDIACPWCWVGKRHLEAARAAYDGPTEVVWRAFELDASAPRRAPGEQSYAGRLAHKYGVTDEEGQQMIDRMTGVGAQVGLDFRFDRIQPTNTFDAHRLVRWAASHGEQEAMKERLFAAYMSEGAWLGDREVLAALAGEVGLDADEARRILDEDGFRDYVRADEMLARNIGVRGVPFFALAGRLGVSGAQPPEVLVEAMRKATLMDVEADDEAAGAACPVE